MKTSILPLVYLLIFCIPANAQFKTDRESGMNSDPEVVYLTEITDKEVKLKVIKEAPVYADKDGNHRLGFLRTDQLVDLEEITDKAYRVRGKGTKYGIAGWVAPWAFSHPDEDFEKKLLQLYKRQIVVRKIIENGNIAIGMTPQEVSKSLGEPNKTSIRLTAKGESGSWEFLDYHEVKHYVTTVDRLTGQAFRTFSHVTREEKNKTLVEFKDGVVTVIEESENNGPPQVRIIVPPLVFGW